MGVDCFQQTSVLNPRKLNTNNENRIMILQISIIASVSFEFQMTSMAITVAIVNTARKLFFRSSVCPDQ